MVRRKLGGPASARLHARNLADRLLFEGALLRGGFRLANQLCIFLLMLLALSYTADPSPQRAVYNNLSKSKFVRVCLVFL